MLADKPFPCQKKNSISACACKYITGTNVTQLKNVDKCLVL